MLGNLSHDVNGVVPRDLLKLAVNAKLRMLQPILGGAVRVVAFLRDTSSTNAVRPTHVDHFSVIIGHHNDVMLLAVN